MKFLWDSKATDWPRHVPIVPTGVLCNVDLKGLNVEWRLPSWVSCSQVHLKLRSQKSWFGQIKSPPSVIIISFQHYVFCFFCCELWTFGWCVWKKSRWCFVQRKPLTPLKAWRPTLKLQMMAHCAVPWGHEDEHWHLWQAKGREALAKSLRRLAESLTSWSQPSSGSVSSLLDSWLKSTNGDEHVWTGETLQFVSCLIAAKCTREAGVDGFKWRRNYYWRTMESSARWVNWSTNCWCSTLTSKKKNCCFVFYLKA